MRSRLLSSHLWKIFLIITMLGFSHVLKVSAAVSTDVLVTISPQTPAPHEKTTISLKSYVENLNTTLITWSVGGKVVASEIGKKTLIVDAPKAGDEIPVITTLYFPSGATKITTIIKPAVMTLLWQANDSYVPPFYRGKALPTPDSEVKVVAMPEIRTNTGLVDSKNMNYSWQKDYTNNQDGSGYGKNAFFYISDYLDASNSVSVLATTMDQRYSVNAYISISTLEQPKIVFYKNDPTTGTSWERALPDTHTIPNQEIVEAIPYFISPKEIRTPVLIWSWFINDQLVTLTDFKKNLMPIQAAEGTHGTSKLKLEIRNESKIFQAASKEINIEF